ncbi:MAG: hemerythrin domain-containing protein [Gammaproteobacteria bacterium]|nr:hemerythrin domain-containing protein [Gammaproteobacteria bacterium]
MLSFDPFAVLADEHAVLTQLFARHQAALVTRAWARAARLLDSHRKRLAQHIELEEHYLLPYCPREKLPNQWPARVYSAEHQRIQELASKLNLRFAKLRRRGVTTTTLIALLDEEKTLKHILGHHHAREETALFVNLSQALSETQRDELAQALRHPPHCRPMVPVSARAGATPRYPGS